MTSLDVSHYLFKFSNKDIIDVVSNPNEWTPEEQSIAKQIINQRGLTISAEDIRAARKNKIEEDIKIDIKRPNNSYEWFMTIAILSIFNTILISTKSNIHFIFGLGYSQVIDGFLYGYFGGFKLFSILISILFSSIFIAIWHFAKAKKNWAYLLGLIVYSLDSLIFIYSKDWLSTSFHIFTLFFILSGYIKIIENRNKSVAQQSV